MKLFEAAGVAFLVLNTRAEHEHLIEVLQAYGRPVVCAFEATGNYHRPIAWRLAEAKVLWAGPVDTAG
ncbi:hypothetical protein MESS2_890004 [Mesorhizobium metallidurans STM 2683]|uniref:Transposase n=1 Tax=Mesorhizobium metallidurans STM 2683 TaxID=1297569 RepID=M5EZ08_9HYPH|nr:hypothetical protein [Mesorhizobium metallidurans]CCV09195.1 hypothetical protein MESS2_890004 [Mesorhizobium metallidurans STM 2683]